MIDPIKEKSNDGDEDNPTSSHSKSGNVTPRAIMIRSFRLSLHIANKNFKTVKPNELIDLT